MEEPAYLMCGFQETVFSPFLLFLHAQHWMGLDWVGVSAADAKLRLGYQTWTPGKVFCICVHNYKVDLLAAIVDCWPSRSEHWRVFKWGLSAVAQRSVFSAVCQWLSLWMLHAKTHLICIAFPSVQSETGLNASSRFIHTCDFNGLHANCWDLDFSGLNMKPLFDRPGVATAERCRAATMSSSADKTQTRVAQMHWNGSQSLLSSKKVTQPERSELLHSQLSGVLMNIYNYPEVLFSFLVFNWVITRTWELI